MAGYAAPNQAIIGRLEAGASADPEFSPSADLRAPLSGRLAMTPYLDHVAVDVGL
jgi:hypothetical protein